jgi:leucyl-tRNA synthetase
MITKSTIASTSSGRGKAYNPHEFESYWQQAWENTGIYHAEDASIKHKYYCLDYFPYPSGEGLHVGHCRNYVPTDVISRFKRMRGFNVLHPMGWDAFGEPAEQNAIRNGVTPQITTDRNTANYKRQMQLIGTSYDWSREIVSSNQEYYRWTQWMFLRMYQRGLAYRDTNWQWWCPTCATTLSSHEVEGDRCWRGHAGVTKKEIPAWYFKITAYADELIAGLDTIDWPEPIVRMQRNWIGRSAGVEIYWPVASILDGYLGEENPSTKTSSVVTTFTTRPDTVYGATFLALAPEHPAVSQLTTSECQGQVEVYVAQAVGMSEIERGSETRPVTGVFTGGYVINPMNQERLPVYVADYVLVTYGTGVVMGVPAHDQRDFEFARKYKLEIKRVVVPPGTGEDDQLSLKEAFVEPGELVNSGSFNGLSSQAGFVSIADYLEATGQGRRTVVYRMRDWLISRQRYWGTPIPIVHCDRCGEVPVQESDLPVILPEMEDFTPDGSGQSPLAHLSEFVNTPCPRCGNPARRETDTMGGFACSSWYFLRFTSPHDHEGPFDQEAMRYWMPVDLYVGGAEQAVLHLLYARFWTKVLADEGLVPFREPFTKLINQGQLHGPDGQRMSKSRGNVIIPDEIVSQYSADALRVYGMFMAPFDQSVDWNIDGINGAWRFLNRVWNLYQEYWFGDWVVKFRYQEQETNHEEPVSGEYHQPSLVELTLERELHQTIQAVTERIESYRFNTMISVLMEFVNRLYDYGREGHAYTPTFQDCLETLLVLLAPTAPYLTEELWMRTGHPFSVHQQVWPTWEDVKIRNETVEIAVQVNGRRRSVIRVNPDALENVAYQLASESPEIQPYLENQIVTRLVYVPGKILNIVTRK